MRPNPRSRSRRPARRRRAAPRPTERRGRAREGEARLVRLARWPGCAAAARNTGKRNVQNTVYQPSKQPSNQATKQIDVRLIMKKKIRQFSKYELPRGSASHLRGFLHQREQVFLPLSTGFRSFFRSRKAWHQDCPSPGPPSWFSSPALVWHLPRRGFCGPDRGSGRARFLPARAEQSRRGLKHHRTVCMALLKVAENNGPPYSLYGSTKGGREQRTTIQCVWLC